MTGTRHLDSDARPAGDPVATFRSILFPAEEPDLAAAREPPFFGDLNLDQVVEAVVAGRDEYELEPFFHLPLRDPGSVAYRQEVFRELERDAVGDAVRAFAEAMQRTRNHLSLARGQHYELERQRWFLDAAGVYCAAVRELFEALAGVELSSDGLVGFRDDLRRYVATDPFASLADDLCRVGAGLDDVRYTIRIKGARVTVSAYQDERDYSVEVAETFARFRERDAESHLVALPDPGSMDHVEAQIAELVARLYPEAFDALAEFRRRHDGFVDPSLARFDREAQFCLAYLEHVRRLARAGSSFCYPAVSATEKESSVEGAFDLALAGKLAAHGAGPVGNDFTLSGPERILVVTGPNQGGKTTFARMFGQLHYLAGLGVPVPGREARLFLPDRLFAHFERREHVATLRGKLDDELLRMREILAQATADSVIVINEILASTTLADAVRLGRKLLEQTVELDCLAVCVTFLDELATLGEATVSMVAAVRPDDPSRRTFEIVRRPADGRAYAWAIADKYGLTAERLKARIAR